MKAKYKLALCFLAAVIVAGLAILYFVDRSKAAERLARLPETPALDHYPAAMAEGIERVLRELEEDPNENRKWLQLGKAYHANGFLDEATACYTALLDWENEAPIQARVHFFLGDIAASQGDQDRALEQYQLSARMAPDHLPTCLDMGEILYKLGKRQDAAEAYAKALEIDASNPYALVGLARERATAGEEQKAIELLEKAFRANPNFNAGKGLMSRLLDRTGQTKRAAKVREENRKGAVLPPKDPWVDELLSYCYDVQRLSFLYEDYKNAGDLQTAFSYLDRVEELDPTNWNAQLLRGLAYAETGRTEAAAHHYKRALEFGGDPGIVYPLLVKALVSTKQFEEAEEVANEAIKVVPNSVDVIVELAGINIIKHEADKAVSLFEKALTIDPYHVRARRFLAEIYSMRGESEKAYQSYEILKDLLPEDAAPHTQIALYHLEKGELSKAEGELSQVASLDVEDKDARAKLAQAFLALGQSQAAAERSAKALASYDRAIQLDSGMIDAHVKRTELLVYLKRYEEAETSIAPLLALTPDDPGIHLAAGDIEFAQGKRDEAKASWERALELLGRDGAGPMYEALVARLRRVVSSE